MIRRLTRNKLASLALAGVFAIGLAACSDDDGDDDTDTDITEPIVDDTTDTTEPMEDTTTTAG